MAERSKRSERRRRRQYISDDEEDDETKVTKRRRRYICDDEEDDETEVTTPPPSSAGEASTARNSAMRPPSATRAKFPTKIKIIKQVNRRPLLSTLLDELKEAELKSSATQAKLLLPPKKRINLRRNEKNMEDEVENPRNYEPNKEETPRHAASESIHSRKLAARHSQENCRGEEDERMVVHPISWGTCFKKRKLQGRIPRPFSSPLGLLLPPKKERRVVSTPLQSSAGKACTATMNPPAASQESGSSLDRLLDEKADISSATPAKRPAKFNFKFKIQINKKKMEYKVDGHRGGEDENPRNKPNESVTPRGF
jgi:hypothetical protein